MRALWRCVRDNPRAHEVIANAGKPERLVQLLTSGIVDAKDYALWSLSSITDSASREAIAANGGIAPLIQSLQGGQLSEGAQEHAARVISGLAPMDENATGSPVVAETLLYVPPA